MNLLTKDIHRAPLDDLASQGDLLTSVSLLAECLERSAVPEGPSDDAANAEAARRALNAALSAECRLADQMDHIVDLRQRIAQLERLAETDELTGLFNRRGFQRELHAAVAAARRYDERGVLVYVDLDGFKPVNDTYGHAAGDEVLRRVARTLNDNVRETDFVGRMGGDEFAVLLTRTTWEDGLKRAEALDRVLNNTYVSWEGRMLAIRASLGFQVYGPRDDGHDILSRADEDMYNTKRMRSAIKPTQRSEARVRGLGN